MCLLVWQAAPAAAQQPASQPGPFVIDVRGATLGLPGAPSWHPEVPDGTSIPTRGFGLNVGAHVYVARVGAGRLGIGVELFETRATARAANIAPAPDDEDGAQEDEASPSPAFPDVLVRARLLGPSVSLNFGTGQGWSYLTAGLTRARVTSEARTEAETGSRETTRQGFNIGGGARWFLSRHVGVGFDLRFHRLSSATMFAASVGFSLK